MTAAGCSLASDVFSVCLTHALSTEREEVMGLLIGDVDDQSVVHVSALKILERSDKRPDRCEISPEQLSDAAVYAESLSKKTRRAMRIVGWYHSHPHITVWPSHVDVRTQADYQMMDERFIGIIFSVFNVDKHTYGSQIQVTCFQSLVNPTSTVGYDRIDIPLYITKRETFESHNLDSLVSLPKVLFTEERISYEKTKENNTDNMVNQIHNSAVYTSTICNIMDTMIAPLMRTLTNRLEHNKVMRERLQKERLDLQRQIAELSSET